VELYKEAPVSNFSREFYQGKIDLCDELLQESAIGIKELRISI